VLPTVRLIALCPTCLGMYELLAVATGLQRVASASVAWACFLMTPGAVTKSENVPMIVDRNRTYLCGAHGPIYLVILLQLMCMFKSIH
jgi:hypothetical protein